MQPVQRFTCKVSISKQQQKCDALFDLLLYFRMASDEPPHKMSRLDNGDTVTKPPTPDLVVQLRSGVDGVSEPASLYRQSAKAAAGAVHIRDTLYPQDILLMLRVVVALFLKPSFLLQFLDEEGGLVELNRKCDPLQFQALLHKVLIEVGRFDLPVRYFQRLNVHCGNYKNFLGQKRQPEHALYRLGIYTGAQAIREANLDPPFNSYIYTFYKTAIGHNLPMSDFFLPPLHDQLLRWMSAKQYRFEVSPLRINNPTPPAQPEVSDIATVSNRSWFEGLSTRDQLLKLCVVANSCKNQTRYHACMLLCFQVLLCERWRTELGYYKIFIYKFLALSFSVFHCPLDLAVMAVKKMERSVIYPSDKHLVFLAKQRLSALYGLFDVEDELFERLFLSPCFSPTSRYFRKTLGAHVGALLRECQVTLLEVWCEASHHLLCSECERVIIRPVLRQARRKLNRLRNMLTHAATLTTVDGEFKKRINLWLCLQRIYSGLCQLGDCTTRYTGKMQIVENTHYLNLLLRNQHLNTSLLFKRYTKAITPKYFEKHYLDDLAKDCIRQDDKADWHQSLMTGNNLFEQVTVMLTTDLHLDHKPTAIFLVDKTIDVYQKLSRGSLVPTRLPILQRVKLLLNNKIPLHMSLGDFTTAPPRQHVFLGTTASQAGYNIAQCPVPSKETADKILNSNYDFLQYAYSRDGAWLSDILRFGQQSLQGNNIV